MADLRDVRRLAVLGVTGLAWAMAVWGAWIPARAVALRIPGVDMAEAVKFLPAVRAGQVHIWREGFLLPQVTLSLFLAFHAWQRRWPFPPWLRILLQMMAAAVALSMLPPAWTPALLRAPEWRLQVQLILLCLAFAALSPVLRFVPARVADALLAALGIAAALVAISGLTQVWGEFERVYDTPLRYGVGVWGLGLGSTGLLVLFGEGWRAQREKRARA